MENVYFNSNFVRKATYGTMLSETSWILHISQYTAHNQNDQKHTHSWSCTQRCQNLV